MRIIIRLITYNFVINSKRMCTTEKIQHNDIFNGYESSDAFACGSPKRESKLHHFHFDQKNPSKNNIKKNTTEGMEKRRPQKQNRRGKAERWRMTLETRRVIFPKSVRATSGDSPQPSSTMSMATLRNMNIESASISVSTRYWYWVEWPMSGATRRDLSPPSHNAYWIKRGRLDSDAVSVPYSYRIMPHYVGLSKQM